MVGYSSNCLLGRQERRAATEFAGGHNQVLSSFCVFGEKKGVYLRIHRETRADRYPPTSNVCVCIYR